MVGDSAAETFEALDNLGGELCIDACIARRKINTRINSVTVYADGSKGCWCNSDMTAVDGDTEFKSCLLTSVNGKIAIAM